LGLVARQHEIKVRCRNADCQTLDLSLKQGFRIFHLVIRLPDAHPLLLAQNRLSNDEGFVSTDVTAAIADGL
jgi:hypothetical protein